MKITDVRVRTFVLPHEEHSFHPTWQPAPSPSHRLTLVEVHTDEGITGIGSGGLLTRLGTTAGFFVGRDGEKGRADAPAASQCGGARRVSAACEEGGDRRDRAAGH